MAIRKSVFAGSWYPAGAADCERQIKSFLEEKSLSVPVQTPVGAIVPHAGWDFSGGVACRAIAQLQRSAPPETLVIFGHHLPADARPCLMAQDEMATPFGALPVDEDLARALQADFDFELETARHFTPDNTIELQMPFLKYFFPDCRIVPIGVPAARMAREIGQTVVDQAGSQGKTIKVLGSTDLTHYGPRFGLTPYGIGEKAFARVKNEDDPRILDLMAQMKSEDVLQEARLSHNACCAGAAAAALAAGQKLGAARAHLTEYASSYDKHPDDSFVGYAGLVF